MRRKRLYLHIGVPKTGTSYIQSSLAYNRDKLSKNGVVYPVIKEPKIGKYGLITSGNGELLAQLLNLKQPEQNKWRSNDYEYAWSLINKTLVGTNFHKVLISSEILPTAKRNQLEHFRQYVNDMGYEVIVIVFVRSFLEHAFSSWMQRIKHHASTDTWEEVCSRIKIPTYDVLKKYCDVFGRKYIYIYNYDMRRNCLLETLSNVLEIPQIESGPVYEVNRSLALQEISRMLFVNELSRNNEIKNPNQISCIFSDLMVELDSGQAEKCIIQSKNAWVNFLGNNKKALDDLNNYFLPEEPVKIALKKPKFGEMNLPQLNPAEMDVLSAIHSMLSNDIYGSQLKQEQVSRINEPSLYLLSAQTFQKQKDWDEAIWAAEQAIQLAAHDPRAYLELAKAYEQKSDYSSAYEAIRNAIIIWPENAYFHNYSGRLLSKLNNWKEAKLSSKKRLGWIRKYHRRTNHSK